MGGLKLKSLLLCATISCVPAITVAQEAGADGDIIVTARKRDETSLQVPVVLTAVSGAELERRAIVSLDTLARIVPQLQIGASGGSVQGGHVGIRGISGSEANPLADQAVSFNIDGVQVARSTVRRMSEMDIGQVEVLKGPQALFFGKNSPAGIISIRSADPTEQFQAKAKLGYETYAREWRGEGFVSGPITDTLGARLALFGTTQQGWFKNDLDGSNEFRTGPSRLPKSEEWAVRGTLKWEPTDRFDARFKISYNALDDVGMANTLERTNCPQGVPQNGGGPENCKLDGRGSILQIGKFLGTLNPAFITKDGNNFMELKQALISHEMNFALSDKFSLTSLTGYYYLDQRWGDNFSGGWNPATVLASAGSFGTKEFSQELRLKSDLEGPVNFLVGAYYQKSNTFIEQNTFLGLQPNLAGVNPTQINAYKVRQKGEGYSGFGQLILTPVDKIEVTAGGRYSFERKRLTVVEQANLFPPRPGPVPLEEVPFDPLFPRANSWNDFSPEVTISYRPTSDLNIFANYKQGFLSGGFAGGATNFAANDVRYDQQNIEGFEGGVKARLFDGAVRTNLALYRYVITGMQITTVVNDLQSGAPVQRVINAGKSVSKGIEADISYKTPLDGLTLRGAVGYNDAKYSRFTATCYTSQTQEQGCNAGIPTSTVINGETYLTFPLQDLSGHQVLRAPKWSGTVGASYDQDINSTLRIGFDADLNFSSSFDGASTASPAARQDAFRLLDLSARLGQQDDSWEVALIGRNLTNQFYSFRRGDMPITGSGTGRAENDPRGRVEPDSVAAAVARGREVMLQLTVRFGQ